MTYLDQTEHFVHIAAHREVVVGEVAEGALGVDDEGASETTHHELNGSKYTRVCTIAYSE